MKRKYSRERTAQLVVVLAAILFFACSEDPGSGPADGSPGTLTPAMLFGSSEPTLGEVAISHTTPGSTSGYSEGVATIFASPTHDTCIDGGVVTAGSFTIEPQSPCGYFTADDDIRFGEDVRFGITGNASYGIPPIADSFYVPKRIVMTRPVTPNGPGIVRSSPLEVRWNGDPLSGGIYVYVHYDAAYSRLYDESLPPDDFWWSMTTPDDGAYSIPTSVLSQLPVDGRVAIGLFRGASRIIGTAPYRLHAYGYSLTSGGFKVVE